VRIAGGLLYLFLVLLPAHADPCWTAGPVVPDRTYQLLPSDEDWSFLRDPALREDFWDPIKYIRLRNHRDDWYLSIGGETRQDWERIGNDNWGEQPFQNAFFLQRYMVHFDVHYGKHYRSFVQLKSGIETFRQGGPRPSTRIFRPITESSMLARFSGKRCPAEISTGFPFGQGTSSNATLATAMA